MSGPIDRNQTVLYVYMSGIMFSWWIFCCIWVCSYMTPVVLTIVVFFCVFCIFFSLAVIKVFYVFIVHGQSTDSLPVGREIILLFTVELYSLGITVIYICTLCDLLSVGNIGPLDLNKIVLFCLTFRTVHILLTYTN